MQKDTVVILVFTDGKKVLVEKRQLEQFLNPQYLIPGGGVKQLEKIEQALMREAMEELGIKILDFTPLPSKNKIRGLKGQYLEPYLISRWDGRISETILDKGNPILWVEFDEALTSKVLPTRKIVQALKEYLTKINIDSSLIAQNNKGRV